MIERSRREERCLRAVSGVLDKVRHSRNASETANALFARFLSAAGMLESGPELLSREGLNDKEAQLLSLIPPLARYSMRTQYGAHPRLASLNAAAGYLQAVYIGVPIEQFFVLCLDASGYLIRCLLLQKGTVDETPFYLPHLLKVAIETHASAVILAHNHPGGTRRPSLADVECTKEALSALLALRIPMLDHLIAAGGEVVSLRETGWIDRSEWMRQDVTGALNRLWLAAEREKA